MESGIYDARGRLIQSPMETKEEVQLPFSSTLTEGGQSALSYLGTSTFNVGNYGGNILIRDRQGNVAVFIGIRE